MCFHSELKFECSQMPPRYITQVPTCLDAGHPWIREDGEAPDRPLDNAVLSRLKQFTAMNKLKKLALKVWTLLYIYAQRGSLEERCDFLRRWLE